MSNIIDLLSGAPAELAELRRRRPAAVENAELSFQALFEPEQPGDFSVAWRYFIAAFIAGISAQQQALDFYRDLVEDEDEQLLGVLERAIERGASTGPYHGGDFVLFGEVTEDSKLAAGLDFAHLLTFHPKDASAAAIGHVQAAGWSDNAIVSLAQLVAFTAFQLRVAHGVGVLGGAQAQVVVQGRQMGVEKPGWEPGPRTLTPEVVAPEGFVEHPLAWRPWVPDLPKEEFSAVHLDALIKPERIDMEYFRLLARDPAALKARTLTDLDIFYNTEGGLGRAERELAATVVSRLNGCEYCASVHQARSKQEGGDANVISRLLRDGVDADMGTQLWAALRDAAVALTVTPFAFDHTHVCALREVGLDDTAIIDVINSSAFFNWANRLMLTLGAPDVPKRYR